MTGIFWLASYPKSGNTWVRLFLEALRNDKDVDLVEMDGASAIASSRTLLGRFLDIDLADLSPDEVTDLRPLAYRAMARTIAVAPFIVKVHDQFGATPSGDVLFPPEAAGGCIHLVRDPRDVCLSLAAHDGISLDLAIRRMGDRDLATSRDSRRGRQQVREYRGAWSDHCASWLAAPMPRLTVRYEDMVAEPRTAMGAIARFCGLDLGEAAVAMAVERTEFNRLAAREAETGFRERLDHMPRFFRSGRTQQWREALTAEQIEQVERDHGGMMRRLGYDLVHDGADETLSRSGADASG